MQPQSHLPYEDGKNNGDHHEEYLGKSSYKLDMKDKSLINLPYFRLHIENQI